SQPLEQPKFEKLAMRTHPKDTTDAWNILSAGLPSLNEDAAFWWQTTGSSLGIMLFQAGYDMHGQYEGLLFHYRYVVGWLGPRPTTSGIPRNWKSYIADDFSPLEYSWSWESVGASPKVRYLIEAIGPNAGMAVDPFNQEMTMDLVKQLPSAAPNSDWKWFNHFTKALCVSDRGTSIMHKPVQSQRHSSSIFMAFELRKNGVDVKSYFIPVKAIQTGQSPLAVVSEGIKSLENETTRFPALDQLVNFMTLDAYGSLLSIVGLAIDCVEPIKSRLKFYVRSPQTSFESVSYILTMAGKLRHLHTESILQELHEIWWMVLGLDEAFSRSEELPASDHETSGILYNFDIKPGNEMPESK
ncbi:MAG: hypothetical protein Q9187_009511, partial [Circinaria calcarea]